jgi:hypothetical protein
VERLTFLQRQTAFNKVVNTMDATSLLTVHAQLLANTDVKMLLDAEGRHNKDEGISKMMVNSLKASNNG